MAKCFTYYFIVRYFVKCNGTNQKQTISHASNSESGRLVTTWTGLRPQQSYTFTVICIIEGKQCPGVTPSFTASTVKLSLGMHLASGLLLQSYKKILNNNSFPVTILLDWKLL